MEDQPEDSDNVILIFCNLLLGAIFFSAFVANVLVLLVFYRKSGLRSIANRFVVNLMIINLVSCVSLLPISLADNSAAFTDGFLCLATEVSSVFCSSVIIYGVLLIALDQYCAVVDPLHYHRIISSAKSNLMILSSWCLSAVFALLDGVEPSFDDSGGGVFRHCRKFRKVIYSTPNVVVTYRYVFCTIYAVSVFVIPFVLICVIYYRICVAASGNTKRTRTGRMSVEDSSHKDEYFVIVNEIPKAETSNLLTRDAERPSFVVTRPSPPKSIPTEVVPNEMPLLKPTLKNNSSFSKLSSLHIQFSEIGEQRRHSDPALESPSIHSSTFEVSGAKTAPTRSSRSSSINSSRHPASRASSIRSTSSYIVHNIRHRISNASLFRYREEARAARISALVIVMALVCWLPFFAVFYLHSALLSGGQFPLYLDSFSIAFLLISAVFSPFLFAFRNRKIKKEIRKMLNFGGNDCAKSFYKYNFSTDIKSQKGELFIGAEKNVVAY